MYGQTHLQSCCAVSTTETTRVSDAIFSEMLNRFESGQQLADTEKLMIRVSLKEYVNNESNPLVLAKPCDKHLPDRAENEMVC